MRLGEVLRKWRIMSERPLREVAAEMGISASTLSRAERGDGLDGETLARILEWLMKSL